MLGRGGVQGFGVAVEVGPGGVVVEAGVEEFAGAQGGVAVVAEEVWESDPVGVELRDAGGVAEDFGRVRRMAGEQGGARGIAERELAVVAVEADALGGELVDVGRVRVEAGAVAGELGAHVVGHEEEDVERALALVGCFCGLGVRVAGDRRCGDGGCGAGEERAA